MQKQYLGSMSILIKHSCIFCAF